MSVASSLLRVDWPVILFKRYSQRTRRKKVAPFRPWVEWLEDRTLLSIASLVMDINPGPVSSHQSEPFGIVDTTTMVELNGLLYFGADDGVHGFELWRSDGTAQGTALFKDIYPGVAGSLLGNMINVNGTLFFTAWDSGPAGLELWKSDGTAVGTVLVKDIALGSGSSQPFLLTGVGNTLFFSANTGVGRELWKSDGTAAGTVLVKDIYPGFNTSNPNNLTNVNGTLFFNANDGTLGAELWKSDGTEAGTVLVKDIMPGLNASSPTDLAAVNGTLFFRANDGPHGLELWKSDGTEAGTVLVKDIVPGVGGSGLLFLVNVNGTLFFTANAGFPSFTDVWKSDGTEAGTVPVKDLPAGAFPQYLTNVNGILYFQTSDGINGVELWKSDGTAAGTVLVKDLNPGVGSSNPEKLTNMSGRLFFRATDGINGVELWESDGTAAGTVMVRDINPGIANSSPFDLRNVNGQLLFAADDGTHGRELWLAASNQLPDVFWDGEAGDFRWDTPLNWSTNALPTATQDAFINVVGITVLHPVGIDSIKSLHSLASLDLSGGSLSLTDNSTISGTLIVDGGTLTGSADVTAAGTLNWTSGTMSGSGTIFANGGMAIGGSATKVLDTRTLNNAGSATWTGTGNIDLANGARIVNEAGATFDVTGDARMVNGGGAAPLFDNRGSFRKSDGGGFPSGTHIVVPFDNHGAVQVTQGILDLSGGGTSTGGFALDELAWVRVTDASLTYTLDTGTSITGGGPFIVDGGHVRIAATDVPAQYFLLNSGPLDGAGTLRVTGALAWYGGTMAGLGQTVIDPGAVSIIDADTAKVLEGRTFRNKGTATWLNGNVELRYGARIVNEVGATFDVTGDASMVNGGGDAPLFDNQGTFTKSDGAGYPASTTVVVPFDNHGAVQVTQGILDLSGGGTSTGGFALDELAWVRVTDASLTYTLDTGTSITGGGPFIVDGGHVRIAATDVPAQYFLLNSGPLDGAGTLRVTGALAWYGGTMAGLGQTVIDPGAVSIIDADTAKVLEGRTFRNKGTVNWARGDVVLRDGAQIVNEVGATFDVTGDNRLLNGGGDAPLFDNQGTFQKTPGSGGTTTVGVPFNSSGTVNVQIGTVDFSGGGTSAGTFTIAAVSSLVFEKDTSVSGVISGAGSLRKSGAGTLTLSGNNTYTGATTVDGGTLLVNGSQPGSPVGVKPGGTLGGTGTTGIVIVDAGGTVGPGTSPGILNTASVAFSANSAFRVEMNGHDPGTGYDELKVTGTVNLGGANLKLSLGFSPGKNDRTFVIIDNDGKKDDVVGTFNGLPQDTVITLGGKQFLIDYKGGDGNDVLLHRVGALQALGGPASVSDTSASLTLQALHPIVADAVATWRAAIADSQALSTLINVGIHIANLSGPYLGAASEHDIWIDRNAAGYGWSTGPNLADGSMDLFTVVAHELGHVLGFEHSDEADDLMAEALPAGIRHLASDNTLVEGTLDTWNAAATGSGQSLWTSIGTSSPSTRRANVLVQRPSQQREPLALLSSESPARYESRSRRPRTPPTAALDAVFAEGEGNWLDSTDKPPDRLEPIP